MDYYNQITCIKKPDRIVECKNLPKEEKPENIKIRPKKDEWPSNGKTEVKNLCCRYRSHLNLVLKN